MDREASGDITDHCIDLGLVDLEIKVQERHLKLSSLIPYLITSFANAAYGIINAHRSYTLTDLALL